jgi:hypothetical protein
MSKISLGQLRDYWKTVSDWVKGVDSVSAPKVKISGNAKVEVQGSYVRLSTETNPTEVDGVKDGDDLLEVDTGKVFIFYSGEWREI